MDNLCVGFYKLELMQLLFGDFEFLVLVWMISVEEKQWMSVNDFVFIVRKRIRIWFIYEGYHNAPRAHHNGSSRQDLCKIIIFREFTCAQG